jgi:hypothetical protein
MNENHPASMDFKVSGGKIRAKRSWQNMVRAEDSSREGGVSELSQAVVLYILRDIVGLLEGL